MNTAQWLGLVTGVLFGFLLQKGRVLRFDKQVGAMLLTDMTIFKFMLSAILVGMVGILWLSNMEIITLSHKSMNVGAVVIGGALFGAGWAIMGFFAPALPSARWGKGAGTPCSPYSAWWQGRHSMQNSIPFLRQPFFPGKTSGK